VAIFIVKSGVMNEKQMYIIKEVLFRDNVYRH
jgi:hypothetical protein